MWMKQTGVLSSSGSYNFPSPPLHRPSNLTGICDSERIPTRTELPKEVDLRSSLWLLLLVTACIASYSLGSRSAEQPATSGACVAGEARVNGAPNEQTLPPVW
jgi:hypothetical protein